MVIIMDLILVSFIFIEIDIPDVNDGFNKQENHGYYQQHDNDD